jgi:glutamate--cysteine ligase
MGLREWGEKLLAECEPVAAAVDATLGGNAYREAHARHVAVMRDPMLVPSARVLVEMQRTYRGSYIDFIRELSRKHRAALMAQEFPRGEEERFARLAAESIEKQKQIEAGDTLPFEEYRKKYLAVERLGM